ncbi:MAG: LysM peptidoglycan-binding domain-containing protein [Bacilli bacterium]
MYSIYNVKSGDTLEDLARRYNTTTDYLMSINNIDSIGDMVGKDIIVPNIVDNSMIQYEVQQGDTVYSIADKFNIEPKNLLEINGLNPSDMIYENEILLVPRNGTRVYFIKENETFHSIGSKLDISPSDLVDLNPKLFLYPGQILIYPDM